MRKVLSQKPRAAFLTFRRSTSSGSTLDSSSFTLHAATLSHDHHVWLRLPQCCRNSAAHRPRFTIFSLQSATYGLCGACTTSPFRYRGQDRHGHRGPGALHVVYLPFGHPLVLWDLQRMRVVLDKTKIGEGTLALVGRGSGVLHEADAG